MPKRHDNLFDSIACFGSLHEAAMTAIRGKRAKPGAAAFMANLETNLVRMERVLRAGSWRGGGYTVIEINDPKPRKVSAAPFRDRVVHHALCRVVAPIFERGFIDDSPRRMCRGTRRICREIPHHPRLMRLLSSAHPTALPNSALAPSGLLAGAWEQSKPA